MRILFATRHSSQIAGAETYVRTVATALVGRGHDVALLAEHPAVAGREPIDGVEKKWCTAMAGEPRALEEARTWAPDVVYVHGVASVRLERGLVALAPAVLFEHSYAGLCISGSRTWQSSGKECLRPLGPGCLAHYFPHQCGGRSPITLVRQYATQRARQRLHGSYRAIVVASRHMAALLASDGTASRVHVLPPPVPPPAVDLPRRLGTPLRVVYLGRLERLKGVHLLSHAVHVAAARLGRPIELHIAGDGPLRPVLEAQSKYPADFGVRVLLPGWQTSSRRDALLSSVDVLAIPSLWPEPFGVVGLEAARFGVPAVAFASGGVGDWLRDGVNGLLAMERSATGLGEALAAVLGDGQRYGRLSSGALAAARAAAPDGHVSKLEELFLESIR